MRHLQLPRDPAAAAAARRAVEELAAGMPASTVRDAKLLVSELVTNAVRHGAGENVRVILDAGVPGRLRCEIVDDGHGFVPRATAPGPHGGWGLRLVEDVAQSWGVREGSTHVWFELGTEARRSPRGSEPQAKPLRRAPSAGRRAELVGAGETSASATAPVTSE